MNESQPTQRWGFGTWMLIIILPLMIGFLLSLFIQRPIVGVIRLDDAISSYTAPDLIAQITYAREHSEIRAVVLMLNSPGGTVTDTEAVYMELNRLRATKPVVTMVEGMAASGAYYLLSATDYAFANPSSLVGNIGVIGYLPSAPTVYEEIYSTGPYKMWGEPRDTYVREMEMLKQGFYSAVEMGRGSRLKASKETILRGQIWPGSEALRLGLIDGLAATTQSYEKAAELAHISHYKTEDLRERSGLPATVNYAFFMQNESGANTAYPKNPGLYMLYIPNAEVQP